MTTVNFAEMLANADNVGEQVPDGVYDIQIVQAEPRKAGTGKDMILVRCQVLTGPHASRVITNNFVLSPDNPTALGFFFRHMTILGLDKNFFAALPPGPDSLGIVSQQLVNKQARITVGTKDGRQNVTNWDTLPGGQQLAGPTQQPAVFNAPAPSPVQNFAPAPQFGGQMPVAPQPQAPVVAQPAVPGPQYPQPQVYAQQPQAPQSYAQPGVNGGQQVGQFGPVAQVPQDYYQQPPAQPGPIAQVPQQVAQTADQLYQVAQQDPAVQAAMQQAVQTSPAPAPQPAAEPPAAPAPQPAADSGVAAPPMPPF